MNYAIRILAKDLSILEKIIETWPESAKTEFAEAYKDRKQKAKELKQAISLLETKP